MTQTVVCGNLLWWYIYLILEQMPVQTQKIVELNTLVLEDLKVVEPVFVTISNNGEKVESSLVHCP